MPALILAILWLTVPSPTVSASSLLSSLAPTPAFPLAVERFGVLGKTGGGDGSDVSDTDGPICIPFIGCF